MNKNKLWMILAALFVAAMVGAVYLYGSLSEQYSPNIITDSADPQTQPNTDTQAGETTAESAQPDTIPAIDVQFYDGDGNKVKLSDFFGKPIVLNLWASWCGPCKREMPYFEAAKAEYGDDVHFLLINVDDSPETVKNFLKDNEYTFEPYTDTDHEVVYCYSTGSIPLTYFIDKDGNIVTGYMGAIPKEALYKCIELIKDGE